MKETKIARAIDVGYRLTKWVESANGPAIKTKHFPSIAPRASDKSITEALGQHRDTVELTIAGVTYEVGADARFAQGSYFARNLADDYCLTPEYLALTRGALSFMNVEHIDLLVVGLPVSTFKKNKDALSRLLTGKHDTANGKQVTVGEVVVLTQPHGALAAYAADSGRWKEIARQRNLIVDPGSRTFDWLVTEGYKAFDQKSGAVNRGMIDVLEDIAAGVSAEIGEKYSDLDRIDRSLQTGAKFTVLGKTMDLTAHVKNAQRIAVDAVKEMRRRIDSQDDSATFIDNIVIAGGGADFFKEQIEKAFPKHTVRVLKQALYANVRGFQLLGMDTLAQRGKSEKGEAAVSGE